jgi:hypothetical protein
MLSLGNPTLSVKRARSRYWTTDMPRLDGQQFNDYVWVDGEPVPRSEIHQAAGFTKRDPEYLLEKNKQKQERKK